MVLLLFSSLPWMTNVIMSDFSTPISLIIIVLVLFYKLNILSYISLGIVFFFMASCHQSHLAIIPVFVTFILLLNILFDKKIKYAATLVKLVSIFGLTFASFFFEKNILNTKEPKKTFSESSPSSDVSSGYYFIAVRMWEVGELDNLLESFCKKKPGNYLCDPDNPYRMKVKLNKGRDRNTEDPYYRKFSNHNKEFVLGCLLKPRFYYACFKAMMKRTSILLKKPYVKVNRPLSGKTIEANLNKVSSKTLWLHRTSKQSEGIYKLNFSKYMFVNKIWFFLLLPLTLAFLLFQGITKKIKPSFDKEKWKILLALIFGHLINVAVCGTFSNAFNERYSARTIWFINLFIIIVVISIIEARAQRKREVE